MATGGRTWARALIGAVLVGAVLTGCGGGDGGGDAEPSATPSPTGPPTEADYQAAQDAINELSDAYGEVYDTSIAAQRAAVETLGAEPPGSVEDQPIVESQEKLSDVLAVRDEKRDALADLDALRDPEVKEAYDTFIAQALEQDQFNDSYYTSFPDYRLSLSVCGDAFTFDRPTERFDARRYARQWLTTYAATVEDCEPVLQDLQSSENNMIRQYAQKFGDHIAERRTIMTRVATGRATMAAATDEYVEAGETWNRQLNKYTKFEDEMARLNARDEFIAFNDVVTAKLDSPGGDEQK